MLHYSWCYTLYVIYYTVLDFVLQESGQEDKRKKVYFYCILYFELAQVFNACDCY